MVIISILVKPSPAGQKTTVYRKISHQHIFCDTFVLTLHIFNLIYFVAILFHLFLFIQLSLFVVFGQSAPSLFYPLSSPERIIEQREEDKQERGCSEKERVKRSIRVVESNLIIQQNVILKRSLPSCRIAFSCLTISHTIFATKSFAITENLILIFTRLIFIIQFNILFAK